MTEQVSPAQAFLREVVGVAASSPDLQQQLHAVANYLLDKHVHGKDVRFDGAAFLNQAQAVFAPLMARAPANMGIPLEAAVISDHLTYAVTSVHPGCLYERVQGMAGRAVNNENIPTFTPDGCTLRILYVHEKERFMVTMVIGMDASVKAYMNHGWQLYDQSPYSPREDIVAAPPSAA